jgi:hypothetical protein
MRALQIVGKPNNELDMALLDSMKTKEDVMNLPNTLSSTLNAQELTKTMEIDAHNKVLAYLSISDENDPVAQQRLAAFKNMLNYTGSDRVRYASRKFDDYNFELR